MVFLRRLRRGRAALGAILAVCFIISQAAAFPSGSIDPEESHRQHVDAASISMRHLDKNEQGWHIVETANFQVLHRQPRAYAERVARNAELTLLRVQRLWFGGQADAWQARCEVYLYTDATDYARATGVPGGSPGHSDFVSDGKRIVQRRIHLRCDHPGLLEAILPHETTHVILAGRFGLKRLPRWADEGMSVCSEPQAQIDRHLHILPDKRKAGELFTLEFLMERRDYPERRDIQVFYSQSVSLVQYLVHLRGHRVFGEFLRDGMAQGYEDALRKHYRCRDYAEFQAAWLDYALPDSKTANRK